MAKQKLSSKAAAAKKRRDIAMAKTPVRKAKKAQNQRIGQRSDSDIHHKNDGSVIRTSIKKNRGNFGRGTKNENNMKKKSSMAKKKFGPKTMKKTTGKSGNLKDVISDVRTKAADVVGKIHSGFDKPLVKNFPGDSAPKNVLGYCGW